jgi:hypothetical protein
MKALYRTKCTDCGEWIEEGDEIEPDEDGGWVHQNCEEIEDERNRNRT